MKKPTKRPTPVRRSRRPAPVEQPRPGHDADGRARVLAAAIESFSQLGYEGTTTAGVARLAGVTQPLVHHHFESKEGLWRAAMERVFAEMPVVAKTSAVTEVETLWTTLAGFVEFVSRNPEATRIIAREGSVPSARLTHLVDRFLAPAFRSVVALIRSGQRGGVISTDLPAELLVFAVLGAGGHLFDVTALARETLGVDTTDVHVRERFAAMLRALLSHGILEPHAASGPRGSEGS